jgi:RHS repeat-associated protein
MTTAQHGYVMVDGNDKGAWQKLELEVPTEEIGYIYIYVANESMDNVDVYFDDLEVQLIDAPVTSASDYYPFGLAMADRSYSSEKYRFGYQGQFAELDEETGWNSFELRMYEPVIGRWLVPDPAGQYYSPYLSMGNNPTISVDVDGSRADKYFDPELES